MESRPGVHHNFMKKIYPIIVAIAFLSPAIALADVTDFKSLVNALISVVNDLIPLMIGIAVIVFILGTTRYIWKSDNAKARQEGRNFLIFGVIAFTVIVCLWGIVNLFKSSLFGDAMSPLAGTTSQGTTGTTGGGCQSDADCGSGSYCISGQCSTLNS
jgi:hypothetical protein